MKGLAALIRLARRDARRDRWRSLLVVGLVALPVAGLVGGITLTDSVARSAEENAVAMMGAADAIAMLDEGGDEGFDPIADLSARLPADVRFEVQRSIGVEVTSPVQRSTRARDLRLDTDALAAGLLATVEGRAPGAGDEVAVSRLLAERLGLGLGETVETVELGAREVVGIVIDPDYLSDEFLLTKPGELAGLAPVSSVLIGLPDGVPLHGLGPDVAADLAPTWWLETRDSVLAQRFSGGQRGFAIVVGGLAVVQAVLIAGAAFAVSVRRRQRELGLLAASGATSRHLRASVLLTGATVGVVGAAAGVVLGLFGAWAGLPFAARFADRLAGPLQPDPAWLLFCSLIGVAAALLAAWWPARTVSRLPITTSLAGRRPTTVPSRRMAGYGVALLATGVAASVSANVGLGEATPFVILLGAVLVVLGAGMASPWLLALLGRTGRWLPTGPRIAVRDAARFRTRNGPIVTAAMASFAATVTIATVLTTDAAEAQATYQPSLPAEVMVIAGPGNDATAQRVAAELGGSTHPYLPVGGDVTALDGAQSVPHAVAADVEFATAVAGPDAGRAIAEGRGVALASDLPARVQVELPSDGRDTEEALAFDLDTITGGDGWFETTPTVLLPAGPLGLTDQPTFETHVVLDRDVTDADLAAASQIAGEAGGADETGVWAEQGYIDTTQDIQRAVTLVGVTAGLIVVLIALALVAAETRSDLRTLTAVGASRRSRASLSAWRALVLAGLGCLLAIPVGLVPAITLLSGPGREPAHLPWDVILLVGIAVPAVACAVAAVSGLRTQGTLSRAA